MKTFLICVLTKVQYMHDRVRVGETLPWKEIEHYYQVSADTFEEAVEKYKKHHEKVHPNTDDYWSRVRFADMTIN